MSLGTEAVHRVDEELAGLLDAETERQGSTIDLIPSENYTSRAVLEAIASVLSAKYAEGYSKKRYYQGNAIVDQIELLAIERAKRLFGVEHVNVQALSGATANHAVYMALCKPGDTTLGIEVPSGGHLSHGSAVTFVARYYAPSLYQVDRESEAVDYAEFANLARRVRPRLIMVGSSSYPLNFDYPKLAEIAKEVGAYLVADIAHVAGLVAAGVIPSPVPHVDVVTTTTHKTLRGPRGALIMCREELADPIDRAVFPGLQGGPFQHHIAGIAVALKEAGEESYKRYAGQVLTNAAVLAKGLREHGFELVTGRTENHLMVFKLSSLDYELSGRKAATMLEAAGIVANRNPIPYDEKPPYNPSGIRYGTPATTTRGMGEAQMTQIAAWTRDILGSQGDPQVTEGIREAVRDLGRQFPIPGYH